MDKILIVVGSIVAVILLVFGISLLMALPIMIAWNYVMPYLFDFKTITFWQSFALMVICSGLIKSSQTVNKKE